jgi:hypothetical protein
MQSGAGCGLFDWSKKFLASNSGPIREKHHDSCRHQAETRIRERRGFVVMPNFLWRHHVNTGKTDAVLYTTSDASLMRNIGQYRAQGRALDGSVVQLIA